MLAGVNRCEKRASQQRDIANMIEGSSSCILEQSDLSAKHHYKSRG